jgi:predicted transglutaminase-like protease
MIKIVPSVCREKKGNRIYKKSVTALQKVLNELELPCIVLTCALLKKANVKLNQEITSILSNLNPPKCIMN